MNVAAKLTRPELVCPAGTPAALRTAVEAGADAVLAASVFHFGDMTIGQVKDEMSGRGLVVRR